MHQRTSGQLVSITHTTQRNMLSLSTCHHNRGNVKSATFLIMQAIYDTVMFAFIVTRILVQARASGYRRQRNLQTLIAAQGMVYYL